MGSAPGINFGSRVLHLLLVYDFESWRFYNGFKWMIKMVSGFSFSTIHATIVVSFVENQEIME